MIYNKTGRTKIVDGHTLYEVCFPNNSIKSFFWVDRPQIFKELTNCSVGQNTIIYGCTFTCSVTISKNCKITHSCFDLEIHIRENCIIDNCFIGSVGFAINIEPNLKLVGKTFYGVGTYDKRIEENWIEYHWPGVSLLMGDDWCRINCVVFDYHNDAAKLFDEECWAKIIADKHPPNKSHHALVSHKPQIQAIIAAKLDQLQIEYNKKEDCCN